MSTWPACDFRTTLGPCPALGAGFGGRCAAHGGACLPARAHPLVLLGQLRTDLDNAIPHGPARVFAVPQKVWAQVAPDGEWPQDLLDPERIADGRRKPRKGCGALPRALRRGNWPQVISGDIARRLLQRGAVARVIATTEWLDGWWLRSLLGPTAPIHVRHTECSDPTLAAELEQRARDEYRRAVELGWACWT